MSIATTTVGPPVDWCLAQGDAAEMSLVRSEEADMVFVDPPYFSDHTERLLCRPVARQTEVTTVLAQLEEFAEGLRNVFQECVRILKPGRALVLKTSDIRYGGELLPLANTHRRMFEELGLVLVDRLQWTSLFRSNRQRPQFLRSPRVGRFRSADFEDLFIFSRPGGLEVRPEEIDLKDGELRDCAASAWRTPGLGRSRRHPYQTSPALARRLLALLTAPGDQVVDPFAGSGQVLKTSIEMGRHAIGYEIDRHLADAAREWLKQVSERIQP